MTQSTDFAIPENERCSGLKDLIFDYVIKTAKVGAANEEMARRHPNLFYALCYPWIADSGGDADVESSFNHYRGEFERLGFDGDSIKASLQSILVNDPHLRACCPTIMQLAFYLDTQFVGQQAWYRNQSTELAEQQFDRFFNEFASSTYSQRFSKIAASHLFNFEADGSPLSFEGIKVVKLDGHSISALLGEATDRPFIHPRGTGEYFVITEDEKPCDDFIQWLFQEREKAEGFARILQYYKDGVVHIDYSVPYFLPQWVNTVRKNGIFFIGDPRRRPYASGNKFYRICPEEIKEINQLWQLSQSTEISRRMDDYQKQLRQVILRAGGFYEASHQRQDAPGRLIDLAIALESLFSPSDKGEFTFRLSQYAGQFIGRDAVERIKIVKAVKEMYERRGALFHGSYNVDELNEGRFVTDEQVEYWASLIRRAILGYVAAFLNGTNNKDEITLKCSYVAEIAEEKVTKVFN